MPERWRSDPDLKRDLPVPEAKQDWQDFLRKYFPLGAWFMAVNALPSYPELPDQPAVFVVAIAVEHADDDSADITLATPGPTLSWAGTTRIIEHDPGVLILNRKDGRAARLDAHTTTADRDFLELPESRMRDTRDGR
jgi:hypothetical protein